MNKTAFGAPNSTMGKGNGVEGLIINDKGLIINKKEAREEEKISDHDVSYLAGVEMLF